MRRGAKQARAGLVLASVVSAGCSTFSELQGGPAVALPTRDDPSLGGALSLHGGIGTSSPRAERTLGLDTTARLKATPLSQQIAFGSGFFHAMSIGQGSAFLLRAGLALGFERYDERLLVGGGPYAGLALGFPLGSRLYDVPGTWMSLSRRQSTFLTIGPLADLDARFSRPSSIAFVGVAVGVAWADDVVESRSAPDSLPPLRP